MNLFVDESVDRQIVDRLRQEGYEVEYVAELSPSVTDDEVLRQANNRKAILVTADKDFGELVFRQNRVHGGVILLRVFGVSTGVKADLLVELLRAHIGELPGAFAVLSPGALRIRHRT
jgi:predicted nuclease of predicted toxin-antitoxin system